jgi:hypothetical protein
MVSRRSGSRRFGYFFTAKRKFIIADAPEHEQFTRNMVTAASTADLAILLVDVRKCVFDQTRRHIYLLWLFGIRHVVVVVNKMDLVHYCQEPFTSTREMIANAAAELTDLEISFIPASAMAGDNVVTRGNNMPWYEGTLPAESARAKDRWGSGQAGFHPTNSTNSRFRTQSFLVPAKKLISKVRSRDRRFSEPQIVVLAGPKGNS